MLKDVGAQQRICNVLASQRAMRVVIRKLEPLREISFVGELRNFHSPTLVIRLTGVGCLSDQCKR